jgi:hypothetical protein
MVMTVNFRVVMLCSIVCGYRVSEEHIFPPHSGYGGDMFLQNTNYIQDHKGSQPTKVLNNLRLSGKINEKESINRQKKKGNNYVITIITH